MDLITQGLLGATLAQTAASMGRKVLIVDADLRRPSVHKVLGIENNRGLMDAILFQRGFANALDTPVESLIQKSPLHENLSVLTTGAVPPEPPAVLASQAMQELVEQVGDSFDLVIYDTPPLLGFADAPLLASQTQGLLLVVGLDRVKRSQLSQVLDDLRLSKIPTLGVVANLAQVQLTKSLSSYYQYYAPEDSQPSPQQQPAQSWSQHISRLVSQFIPGKR